MTDTSRYDDLEPVDFTGTATLDLYDHVDLLLDERIPTVTEQIEEYETALERGVHQEYAEADDGGLTPEEAQGLRGLLEDLHVDRKRAEYTARLFHECAERWDGSEFEVKRNLGFHEVKAASDDVKSMSVRSGESVESATAKDGAYKLRMLEFGVVKAPSEAPAFTSDTFPWQVGEWLYAEFNEINSSGGEAAGNSLSRSPPETREHAEK